jgi:hypothetical protein
MSAQGVFSVAEQVNFQVCFSKVVPLSSVPVASSVVYSEAVSPPPQATRLRDITRAKISARNFFMGFPP